MSNARIKPALVVVAFGLLASACGSSDSDSSDAAAPTTTATTRTTTTSAAPQTFTTYQQWTAAYRRYATSPSDISQSVFDFQMGLCTTLRNGGKPASAMWPAQSAAEVLREGWGVGLNDPSMGSSMKTKGEVAEKVIIPIMCPDQTHVIADAKAGNYTKELRTAFPNGKYIVGQDIAPGTYTISTRVSDCYWERSDAQGNTIDNNFISVAPSVTVTIGPTDGGFTSERCGNWKMME